MAWKAAVAGPRPFCREPICWDPIQPAAADHENWMHCQCARNGQAGVIQVRRAHHNVAGVLAAEQAAVDASHELYCQSTSKAQVENATESESAVCSP